MGTPLLSTKLYIPARHPNLVPRPRLFKKLDAGQHSKLTLVSAPAGYGKTTLISDWIEQSGSRACWITLDESDNDFGRFLAYLIAGLRSIGIDVDEQILMLIRSPGQNQVEDILIPLINQIAVSQSDFSLVLDDYHLISSQNIHQAIEFILEHSPPGLHLVFITRADPPLSLARLRARGQMVEVRESDLRFSAEEGEQFLNQVQGLDLSTDDIKVLLDRTDGWAAALQMFSLSLKGKQEKAAYIRRVSGKQDFIADYLHAEVMNQQPEEITTFLLKTSILDPLAGPLCDAVTGGENGEQILKRLRDENLFLTSLDDESHWFVYHCLFADLLGQQLLNTYPDEVPALYHKASRWFEENGDYKQAIDYAIRGEDIQRAAVLIIQHAEETLKRSEIATFIQWVKRLPDGVIFENDSLCIYYAWALLASAVDSHLAEKYLDQVVPEDEQTSGRVLAVKSIVSLFNRRTPEAIKLARRSLEQLPEADLFFRQIATWNLSALLFISGESEDGADMLAEVARISLASNNLLVAIIALCRLGTYQLQQGNLNQARELFVRALHTRPDGQESPLPAACEALLGLGKVSWERYEIEEAKEYLLEGITLSKRWREITDLDSYLTLAFVFYATGDEDGALHMIDKAKSHALRTVTTDMDNKYVDSQGAWLCLWRGDLRAVDSWASQRGLEALVTEDEIPETGNLGVDVILRYELIVYARFLMAKKRFDEALNLLMALLPLLEWLGHRLKTLEIQVLISLALYAKGRIDEAISTINPVLEAVERQGSRRLLLVEGPLLSGLVKETISQGYHSQFAEGLLDALEAKQGAVRAGRDTELVEALSEREMEVLRLLRSELPAQEIADYLHISVSTVRTHNKNIYSKLGVHSRYEAVSKALDLHLI